LKKAAKHIDPHSKYLYILWATGVLLLAYLCFPFFEINSGMYLGDLLSKSISIKPSQLKRKEGSKEYDANEALFFVTINKKQFLTKFVTYVSDEDLAGLNKKGTAQGNEEKNYVIIDRNKKSRKSSLKDFSIKAAPKI
jgi:hypothetical protein